uniref:Uncharacterized protein n=1 Tax=Anguilla anguilla TaxID=7936 RepID=A0A0E9VC24_ANGAN
MSSHTHTHTHPPTLAHTAGHSYPLWELRSPVPYI